MSARTDRHTRRALRRALGPEALDLVGQQAKALAALAHTVQRQEHQLQALERADLTQHLRWDGVRHDLEDFRDRPWWRRWRWLLKGV